MHLSKYMLINRSARDQITQNSRYDSKKKKNKTNGTTERKARTII